MANATEYQTKVDKNVTNMERFDRIVNGSVTTDVQIDGGVTVPSFAKIQQAAAVEVAGAAVAAGAAQVSAGKASTAASTAEAVAGPSYANVSAGQAATEVGKGFAVAEGGGVVAIYLRTSGGSTFQRRLATSEALALTSGATLLGTPEGTVQQALDKRVPFAVVKPDMFLQAGETEYGPALVRMAAHCHTTGAIGQFDAKEYLVTSLQTITGKNFRWVGLPGHSIRFSGSGRLQIDAWTGEWDSPNFVGKLSSKEQFSVAQSGVAAFFASPTYYKRNSGGVATADAGTGWTHTLAGNLLTVGPQTQGANDYTEFTVESAPIPLDVNSRYTVDIRPGWLTGAMGMKARIFVYDAGNALIGEYNMQAASGNGVLHSGWYALIKNAASIRVQVAAQRHFATTDGLEAIFDLSKMIIYKLENDFASMPLVDGSNVPLTSPGDGTQVQISNSSDVKINKMRASMMDRSALILVGCKRALIKEPFLRYCMHGIGDTLGEGNQIVEPDMDGSFGVVGGAVIGNRPFRMRGVGGSNTDKMVVRGGSIVGYSWAVEILPRKAGARVDIRDLHIEAEFVLVSLDGISSTGFADVKAVEGVLSASGYMGFEAAGGAQGWRGRFTDCHVRYSDVQSWYGSGLAASATDNVDWIGGSIEAPIMINAINNKGTATFAPNRGRYSHSIIYSRDLSWSFICPQVTNAGSQALYGTQAPVSFHGDRGARTDDLNYSVTNTDFEAGRLLDFDFLDLSNVTLRNNFINHQSYTKNKTTVFKGYTGASIIRAVVENNFIYRSSFTATGYWNWEPTAPSTATWFAQGNRIGGSPADRATFVPVAQLRGTTGMNGSASWTPGTIAAGATVESLSVGVLGLAAGDSVQAQVSTVLPAGLLLVNPRCDADNSARASLHNSTSAPITLSPATITLRIRADKL